MLFPRRYLAGLILLFSLGLYLQAQAPAPPPPPDAQASDAANNSPGATVVVVIDSSAEHSGNFGEIRKAASQFVQSVGDDRSVAVVSASDKPSVVADFGAESDEVLKKVADIKPHGTPSIQQGVQFAARYASQETDHPVVVAFVRNPDNTSANANAPAAATVYVIASPEANWKLQSDMQQLAVKSGGTAFFPSNDRELGDVVKETAVRVMGEADFNRLETANKHPLGSYERLIVHEIALPSTNQTSEAGGGEDYLMQKVLVSRIQKAKLFPIVITSADAGSTQSASSAPAGKVLDLRASIIEFRRGNRLQRQMMGIRGGSKMKLRVILVDAGTNRPITSFIKEGSYKSGLWGGSQEAVQSQAILNVANDVVDELKKLR